VAERARPEAPDLTTPLTPTLLAQSPLVHLHLLLARIHQ